MSTPVSSAISSPLNFASSSLNEGQPVHSSALEVRRSPLEPYTVTVQTNASLEEDKALVAFYKCLSQGMKLSLQPILEGAISNKAKAILAWSKIKALAKIQSLDLRNKGLTSLPPMIGEFSGLIMLNLSGNNLTELPQNLGNCKNLVALYATGNRLAVLPKSIGDLQNLTDIDLSDNCLCVLPDEITLLPKLENLTLTKNLLTTLPDGMSLLPRLMTMDLTENCGAAIDPSLQAKLTARGKKFALEEQEAGDAATEEMLRKEAESQQKLSAIIGQNSVPQQSVASSSFYNGVKPSDNDEVAIKFIVELSDDEDENPSIEDRKSGVQFIVELSDDDEPVENVRSKEARARVAQVEQNLLDQELSDSDSEEPLSLFEPFEFIDLPEPLPMMELLKRNTITWM